jgi:hypothetical protein
MAQIKEWLHLSDTGGDPWVLPIWSAAHQAIDKGIVKAIPNRLEELALHISTRLNLIPHIVDRLNVGAKAIYEAIKRHEKKHVFAGATTGTAFPVDGGLKHRFIADIDAFLTEINACAELMRTFFQLVHEHAGKPIADKDLTGALQAAIKKHGGDVQWFRFLDRNRNYVAHEGTPYLAVDVTSRERPELLVMKQNLRKFDDTEKFFRLSELNEVAQGFIKAEAATQEQLVALFQL